MKRMLLAASVLLLAGACHEIPQDAPKSFAGKAETQLYDGARFKDDKPRFEKALGARAQGENEYVRMGDMPKRP